MAVPKLRFKDENGVDCSEWERKRLKNIASRITRKNSTNETDLPLTISSIDGLVDQRTYFKKQVASKDMSGYYLLYNGEFAYNKSYSVGYDFGSIKRLDKYDKGALSTLYICFSLNDTCDSDFVKHFFDSSKWNSQVYKNCAEGARNHGLLNISADDFMSMEINIPSVEEQQKIAYFLTTFDKRITAQQNIIADMEEIKKGLLQKIFSQEIRFKDDNGETYPEWKKKKIADLGNIITGTTPSVDKIENYNNGDILFVTPVDMTNKNIVLATERKLTKVGLRNARVVEENSILVVCIGATIGKCSLVLDKCSCNQQINAIMPYNNNSYFILLLMRHLEPRIKLMAGNTATPILNKKDFSNIDCIVPCLEEQNKIASFLSTYDKKIEAEKKILADLQEMKKGLLQQLFV